MPLPQSLKEVVVAAMISLSVKVNDIRSKFFNMGKAKKGFRKHFFVVSGNKFQMIYDFLQLGTF